MVSTTGNSMDEFDKEFMYLYDICIMVKQKIYIGKFLLKHSELFNASKKCRLIIVDALFHSAAVNLCKISDSKEAINVVSFGNKYRKKSNKEDKEAWKALQPKKADLEQLQNRRNKNLVHSDRENIELDIDTEYPLYIETLERVATAEERMLDYIYKCNKSASIIGVDKKTGQPFTLFDIITKKECEAVTMYAKRITAMQKYMKEKHPAELAKIIYLAEGIEKDEQTENEDAEEI